MGCFEYLTGSHRSIPGLIGQILIIAPTYSVPVLYHVTGSELENGTQFEVSVETIAAVW